MEESKRYEIHKYVASLISLLIDGTLLIYLLKSGATLRLRDAVQGSVFLYLLALGIVMSLIHFPVRFYASYLLEHRFGLSRQSFRGWLKDYAIGLAVGGVIAIGGAEVVYALMRAYPNQWWLYSACLATVFAVVMTNLAPVVLLPLFFKFKPVESKDLSMRVEHLSRKTGTPICGIFEWSLGEKTRKANAAVVGWGNTRRIIVSDTLLENFSADEIEVILAHELCHHVKNHIWRSIGAQTLWTFFAFLVTHGILIASSAALGFNGISDVANMPLLALVLGILSVLSLPAMNALSRRLERDADRYALDVTEDSLAFVSGMEKLGRLNLANTSPHQIIEAIFYSHPSIEKRIRMAADWVFPHFAR
jgi:STE24 endopeptidase